MCVASISYLGFLAATWVLDPSLLHPFMQDPSIIDLARWARPLSAYGCGTVRPISWRSVNLDFTLFIDHAPYSLYFVHHIGSGFKITFFLQAPRNYFHKHIHLISLVHISVLGLH